jgi:hypothetical protein
MRQNTNRAEHPGDLASVMRVVAARRLLSGGIAGNLRKTRPLLSDT